MAWSIVLVSALISAVVLGGLRGLHRSWWERRAVRYGAIAVVVLAVGGAVLRLMARTTDGLASFGVVVGSIGIVLLLSLFLSLPVAALVRWVLMRVTGTNLLPRPTIAAEVALPLPEPPIAANVEAPTPPIARTTEPTKTEPAKAEPAKTEPAKIEEPRPLVILRRRRLIEAAAAAVPVAALGTGFAGLVGGFSATQIVHRPMHFPGLSPDLAGLRILHFTDMHVGLFLQLRDVEKLVERAAEAKADLVVLTGDICDVLSLFPDTLKIVSQLAPRLGTVAIFGNHEHYRGVRDVLRAYAEAPDVELLRNEGRVRRVGSADLTIVGMDDPGRGRISSEDFFRHADASLDGTPSDAFRLALCHRPSGFERLAERGAHLTLSGHTHGAQLGDGERSLLEGHTSERYMWGRYQRGESQLYTSSGAGHWFAFRLACPSEVALITLEPGRLG